MRRPAHPFGRPARCLAAALLLAGAPGAMAETRPAPAPRPAATGKERLGDKASDQQRVDDCNVPPERRGPQPRPTEGCRR